MTENPLLKHHGKFSTIESKLKEYPIIGFDSEDDSKGTPLLFGFFGDFTNQFYVSRHWEEALEFIYSIEQTTVFVAHNLEYDIANLFKGSNYLMVDEMIYSSKLLKVSLYGTTHYFMNSHCWFSGPLKKMGDFIGLPKFEGAALDEKYLKRDCEIVYKFTKMFQKKLQAEAGVNLGVTVGKMAMDTYRRNFMLGTRQITYSSPNCLKAYYGGRVEIFYKGFIKNIKVMDINSCYPYVMKTFPYPDTERIEPSSIHTHEYGIGKFTVNVPEDTFIPVLPFKPPGGKLFFPVGEFTGWWVYAEVRYAVECGAVIIKEHSGEGTNAGCYPFTEFIDTFYDKRVVCKRKLKKNPDDTQSSFDSLYYKLWMNNLYGKWCQNKSSNTMTRDKWPQFKLDKLRENPQFKESKIGPFYNYYVPKETVPQTANFMWGIYVTAYSRIYLHRGMYDIHTMGGKLLYCDTDSIMFTMSNKKSTPLRRSDELGDWDLEKFDLGVYRQSKGYLLCNKVKGGKMKMNSKPSPFPPPEGRGKHSDKPTAYEIVKCACKGVPTHLAHDFIIDGLAKTVKPLRMKEALIRMYAGANIGKDKFLKEIGENVWSDVEKEMRSIYIKRKGSGVTYPVNVTEIKELEENCVEPGHSSIRGELEKADLFIQRPDHKNLFENTVIPAGYFKQRRTNNGRPQLYISQKVFYFRREHCLELASGKIWFAGDCLQVRRTKKGKKFYYFYVTHFKGKKVPINFWGAIWVSFFADYGLEENLLNKNVEIRLSKTYLIKGSLELKIKVSAQKNEGQFDSEEIQDADELTETEIENLKSFDWNKIKCLQKNLTQN